MIYLLIFILIVIIYYFVKNKVRINITSFFKKGFKKIDSAFRRVLLYAESKANGKTYSAISFLIKYKLANPNVTIITNCKTFNVFPDIIYEPSFTKIMQYCIQHYHNKNIIIFYDEIFSLIEKSKNLSKSILLFLSQLRKRKIILITTAQEWLEINITFRRYIRYQINCNMISLPFSQHAVLINEINDGDEIKWDNLENEYIAPRVLTRIFKGEKSIIESYDTFETINTSM